MLTFKQGRYSGTVTQTKEKGGATACITQYSPTDFNNDLHCHENTHFSFMLYGGCVEKKRDTVEMLPGNIMYYHPGEQHQVVMIAGVAKRVNVELGAFFFDRHNISETDAAQTIIKNPDYKFLMMKVYKELLNNDSVTGISIQQTLLQLTARQGSPGQSGRTPQWVPVVEEYLRTSLDDNLSLTELALIANLHPVTISKQFSKYFNCTIGEYKRKLKIEKSIALIKSSRQTLSQIAQECGFFDQSHFIRTFKKVTGFLPLEYRKG
ncbi:MAG: AraC family transcriptional regulator [Ferruginibacter sp.]|uniref:AraC family transcriptional regulator n=1 Tax=Ferruginibacter sp. TaxID=1940288 RepID=UPI0026592190|nr:AraC family transcriptional regulator [Ferruginibacter sp.]MDB5278239.1 AraC family transcriptional regulator [Ferruginibacter sp.]